METKNWSLPTRFLHLGLVLTVTAQLFVSTVMVAPDPEDGQVGNFLYGIHETVGMVALSIVLVHWLWSLVSYADGGLKHLFPWGEEGRKQVVADFKALSRMEFSQGGNRGGLAGLVHGLGLLAVTGIAITGGVLFFSLPESGDVGFMVDGIAELHEVMATFVWAYWIGHGGIALLHHMNGHDTLKKIFRFGKAKSVKNSDLTDALNHLPKNL